jgi:outer membrane lipoprotein-sorting protein
MRRQHGPVLRCGVFIVVSIFTLCACAKTRQPTTAPQIIVSTTPPFPTKEPERYQAIRTITSLNVETSETKTTRIELARAGNARREVYDLTPQTSIVYLQSDSGRFVVVPAEKTFASLDELKPDTVESAPQDSEGTALSTERLLHQRATEMGYEKMGNETVSGRAATKYRVTATGSSGGTGSSGETLIWVDEALGMPIKWEMTGQSSGSSKTTMELSAISLDVDPDLFAIPVGYKKVEAQKLLKWIAETSKGVKAPKRPGE